MNKRVVLDASALICFLFEEPGHERVAAALDGAMIGSVNLAEVIAKLVDKGANVERMISNIALLEIEIVPFDQLQAEASGRLRASTRGAGLSLGDRSCFALAQSRGATALTGDRDWLRVADAAGVEVEMIR